MNFGFFVIFISEDYFVKQADLHYEFLEKMFLLFRIFAWIHYLLRSPLFRLIATEMMLLEPAKW